jgi:ketosteroid isomerase-like protein
MTVARENVEIVRALWRAFETSGVPADVFAEEVAWHTASDMPDSETRRGREAILQKLAVDWENTLDPGCKAEEFLDAGKWVLVRWRGWGTGRASGVPVTWHETHTYELRDGKVVEVHEYRTWEEALRAVGRSG